MRFGVLESFDVRLGLAGQGRLIGQGRCKGRRAERAQGRLIGEERCKGQGRFKDQGRCQDQGRCKVRQKGKGRPL